MTTMTSKGQVTVPKPIRDYLGIQPGGEVDFELSPSGEVMVRAAKPAHRRVKSGRFTRHRGMLRTGQSTDALMRLLRGYNEDANDPGFQRG